MMKGLRHHGGFRAFLFLFACTAMLFADAQQAQANNPLDGQPSIRNKKLYLSGRQSVAPLIGFTVNDAYSGNFVGGLAWRYHLSDWLGIGADLAAGVGYDTDLSDDINTELSSNGNSFQLSTSSLSLAAFATIEIVPFEGKFNLMNWMHARIDVHLDLGFGIAMIGGTGRIEDSTSLLPVVGAGIRFFPTTWIGISLDIRDLIMSRVLSSRRDGSLPAPEWTHTWLTTLSVGFYFPTGPETQP
jgi:outer membrane beta-barrel protein